MQKIITMLTMFLVCLTTLADVKVKGYYRKSGVYVHPYTRTSTAISKENKMLNVKGYHRKSGTFVHSYHRTNPKTMTTQPTK